MTRPANLRESVAGAAREAYKEGEADAWEVVADAVLEEVETALRSLPALIAPGTALGALEWRSAALALVSGREYTGVSGPSHYVNKTPLSESSLRKMRAEYAERYGGDA